MAKKKSGFNMSQAVRDHLTANPNASAKETLEALTAFNPKLNKGSFSVAYYTARRKGKRTKVVARKAAAAGMSVVDFEAVRLVKKLVDSIGAATAIQLIKAME